MLNPGIYEATVTNHWWTTSASGNPGLKVEVSVLDAFDGSEQPMTGTIWMTPKSMGMARAQLRALGFDPDADDPVDLGASIRLDGNQCEVELKEETYQGRTSLKIARFGAGNKPPTPEQLAWARDALRAAKHKESEEKVEPPAKAEKLHPALIIPAQQPHHSVDVPPAAESDDYIPF